MLIDLECKCTVKHRWELVARFTYGHLAAAAAIALSEHEGCPYRTIDRRFPEEPLVETFVNGAQV
jgi:hypothetical protein